MQETLFKNWFAGFFDAEGCVRINKSKRKDCITYSPRLILVNTHFFTMERISSFLKGEGINHYVGTSKPTTNRKIKKTIEISRLKKALVLVNLLLAHGAVTKRAELELLKIFLSSRISKFGPTIRPIKIPYSLGEKKIFADLIEYKAHKKGSKCLSYEPKDIEMIFDIDFPWLAGFSDGDGSFSINKNGTPSYCIGTTHPATFNSIINLLDFFKVDGYISSTKAGVNHLECCKLTTYKVFVNRPSEILKVVPKLQPYLCTKKEVANLFVDYCISRLNRKNLNRSDYELDLAAKIKELNKDPSEAICETL